MELTKEDKQQFYNKFCEPSSTGYRTTWHVKENTKADNILEWMETKVSRVELRVIRKPNV